MTTAETMITSCRTRTSAPNGLKITAFWSKNSGKALEVSRPNSLPASWERKKEAPIAEIRNASLGAPRLRSGR